MPSLVEQTFWSSPTLSWSDSLVLDVFCALAVHGIYNKYEVGPGNIPITLLLLIAVPAFPCYFISANLESTVLALVLSYLLFYFTLALSVILYRVSPMHPLARYPGPLSLRVSKFVGMYRTSGGKQYTLFKSLHDKYGPFVRVGPNELSIADAEAIIPVLGGMRKGPMWDAVSVPGTPTNISALRDVQEHAERRKLWNHGFTTASLKEIQPAVEERVVELVEELSKRVSAVSGQKEITVDFAEWLSSFAYDLMGDLVFGGAFGFISRGGKCEMRHVIEGHMRSLGTLGNIPWITGLLFKVAAIPEAQQRFMDFASERYDKRKGQGGARKDLFHYITNEEGLEKAEVSRDQGISDILIAMIGGADTSSTVLSGVFYHLLSNRSVFDRLREEVDSEFPLDEGGPFDTFKLATMPYLNAVINETLRLQPPAASCLQRCPLEGSGGNFVKGRFIPENAAIFVPPYVLHRDPRYFSPDPDSFIPERWLNTENGKFTTNTSAFIPFSHGFANCAGKNLAWMEMRMIVAAIVQRFDMKFARGYDPCRWEEDLRDFLAMQVGELPVVLYARG